MSYTRETRNNAHFEKVKSIEIVVIIQKNKIVQYIKYDMFIDLHNIIN